MAATDADAGESYVEHPLLAEGFLEDRRYQSDLVETAVADHTLVCLPTGLGKTTVSLRVTAERLRGDVGAKSLLLAPTKPLVEQHAAFYREALEIPEDEIVVFTGDVRPDDRAALWNSARVVVATPQVVENDLVGGRIDLRDVVHVTFDECHRASGDYAYVYIAERYHADAADPLVTGMSASPGGDEEEILSVCANLGVREVAVMTEDDADVADYTHDTDVEWERIDLPEEVLEIRDSLNDVITERLEKLKELGVTRSTQPDMSQTDLNRMRGELRELIDNDQSEGYEGMSLHAEVMKLRRAVELVETQSVESVRRYFERQRNAARSSGASKASQRLVSEPRVKEAMRRAEEFDGLHPKFRRVRMLLAETLGIEEGERVIVFTESRDTAEALTEFLGNHFDARRFVGQGDKEGSDGMSQKEQGEVLDAFKAGEFEVLVSTSVAEEGLDVPEVDLVCFFEPVPTAIRSVQRKGRTGRQAEGRVVVLMAEDTRDEAFFWISRRREQEMEEELRSLQSLADDFAAELGDQGTLDEYADGDAPATGSANGVNDADGGADGGRDGPSSADGQAGLADFEDGSGGSEGETDDADEAGEGASADAESEDESTVARADPPEDEDHVEVVVDQRELESTIARDLSKREHVETRLETLAVGDYVLSDRVALERKSVADFLDTLLGGDRDLFEQARDLARHYDRPVLVLEGGDLYGARNVHPNAIRGALASLAVDYGLSVLRTEDEDDTADMLDVIAGREQLTRDREVSVHGEKGAKTLAEQQEYVVSSIADVGPVTARALLTHFGSVEAVMTADEETLMEADGVGEVTAERVREVVASDYE
ncbi:Fanconi anemia group M protein [Halarchaeum rubridurum]|uniref:Fanconi anemia group M protein n=1 Tax=Halarchaeum rubridurum TaxID=489911 RepID=A0A830G4B0_9EURY|nr:DEAD/DEAH box helicase [Halarchaeum rubridurum]MBP1955748.1 Fanconi anemia group M protein [Halarchaeum rubridurum]GGM74847.1 Hef nuclease [Halarchaeum rubridurum]